MFMRTEGGGNQKYVKYYVQKGIKVCPEWYEYSVFKKWALQNGFEPGANLVLDRINSSGNYNPENCQWLTKSEHALKDR